MLFEQSGQAAGCMLETAGPIFVIVNVRVPDDVDGAVPEQGQEFRAEGVLPVYALLF